MLRLLFGEGVSGSSSELARRAGVTPRAATVMLHALERAGLVTCEGVGTALVFRARTGPLGDALAALLASEPVPADDRDLDAAVAFHGAPLLRAEPSPRLDLEETIARASKRARRDPTLLRALPVLVARNRRRIDWPRLRDCAVHANSRSEVGFLLDLTGELGRFPDLCTRAQAFRDRRRRRMVPFFAPRNPYDEKLARARTPSVARSWKFMMNMDLETLRSGLERHETPRRA